MGRGLMRTLLKRIQPSQTVGTPASPGLQPEQRRRLQLALAVLVLALIVVVVRDIRDLQPPAPVNPESATITVPSTPPTPAAPPAEAAAQPAHPESGRALAPSKAKRSRVKRPAINTAEPPSANELPGGPTIVATNRAVLPPLQVEVVAGNQRRPLAPASNSVSVDMQSGISPDAGQAAAEPKAGSDTGQTSGAAQVSVSPDVAEHVVHSVAPSYPLLAKQMKVQGAVVLQALIDKGGRIQSLRVLSGPTILAAAAEEAVKQWRFKPYYERGQPVETEARVSVNFTISTF